MMHAQTNLQLYRQLLTSGHTEEDLARIRASYELARALFIGRYRASGKPFIAHLVGHASALARWGASIDLVAAGLLHSAYLHGGFGDGTVGPSIAKARVLRERVGVAVHDRVERYSALRNDIDLAALDELIKEEDGKELVMMILADLSDDWSDLEPHFSPQKPFMNGLPHDRASRLSLIELAEKVVGRVASEDFMRMFRELDAKSIPAGLATEREANYKASPGVPELHRSKLRIRVGRLWNRARGRRPKSP